MCGSEVTFELKGDHVLVSVDGKNDGILGYEGGIYIDDSIKEFIHIKVMHKKQARLSEGIDFFLRRCIKFN